MTLTWPRIAKGPVLDLGLPVFTDPSRIMVTNQTTGESLSLLLPGSWDGDDLELDFDAGTILDQTGADRSSLLDPADAGLWTPEPMIEGINDVEISVDAIVAASSGPLSPDTGSEQVDSTNVNTQEAWSGTGNIIASEDTRATCALDAAGPSGFLSRVLKATDFDFAIPTDATITGLILEVERSVLTISNAIYDQALYSIKGGTIQEDSTKHGEILVEPWPTTTDAYRTYGSSSDLWGRTWTPADINATTFGFGISAQCVGLDATCRVDHMRATVHYYAGDPTPEAFGGTASLRWSEGHA